ncbi:hypothetical protein GGR57DRAFT_220357 [Xylariaceae sp. FL1272]|nr:hypothetical protein GGR57DRAFT_220357 [Xylariaceae sp. FL1272]
MVSNILITGAAGYIGGSLVAALADRELLLISRSSIFAVARSKEQTQSLSPLGVNALNFDVLDEHAVADAVLENEIDIVVHTAGSIDPSMAIYLIKALGKRRKVTGKPVFHIHSSVTTGFSKGGGWPYGTVKDNDPIYKLEKELNDDFPIRKTDIILIETAEAQGVTNFILPIPLVYGAGNGPWKRLSQQIPAAIRSGIATSLVHKFDEDSVNVAIHVNDLTQYYISLVAKILQGEKLPSGEHGYYFPIAHTISWWKTADRIAEVLHARGLATQSKACLWSSEDAASESLQLPRAFVRLMYTCVVDVDYDNGYPLGWKPVWNEEKFYDNLANEVDATLKYDDKGESTLFDVLKK